VLEFDLFPQFSLLLNEVFLEKEAKRKATENEAKLQEFKVAFDASAPLGGGGGAMSSPKGSPLTSPHYSPKSSPKAGGSAVTSPRDISRLKSVKEIFQDEAMMQSLLMFCNVKQEQDCVLFATLVFQYKKAPDAVRKNMAQNILSDFVNVDSIHYLSLFSEKSVKNCDRELKEKLLCPPMSLFNELLNECFIFIDSGLFKRFQKSKIPAKKKTKLFKTLASKRQSGERKSRLSFNANKDETLLY
jgi:hypothetical protein